MDFNKFYNKHDLYIKKRDKNSEQYKDYQIEIAYKVDNLIKVLSQKKAFDNILEIGCSNGLLINELSGRLNVKNIFGIDISTENIIAAQTMFPKIQFYAGTFEEFIKDNADIKFDLIILSDIIEHVPDDKYFMQLVAKYCRSVLINLPLEKSFINRNRNYGENDPSGHLRAYDFESGIKVIQNAGIKILKYRTIISIRNNGVYEIYKKRQRERLKGKKIYKRILLQLIYFMKDQVLIKLPTFYSKIFGHNLFCYGEVSHS